MLCIQATFAVMKANQGNWSRTMGATNLPTSFFVEVWLF